MGWSVFMLPSVELTLKTHSSTLNQLTIIKNTLLHENMNRQYPERQSVHYSTHNVKCLSLYPDRKQLLVRTTFALALLQMLFWDQFWHCAHDLCWATLFKKQEKKKPAIFIIKIMFGDFAQYSKISNVWRTIDKILSPSSTVKKKQNVPIG